MTTEEISTVPVSQDNASVVQQIFTSEEFGDIRVVIINNEPWFAAVDVCHALDIKNVSDAVKKLDDDEKGIALTDTPGGQQQLLIVNEPGLYSLVLSSRKESAKRFKRWLTHDVIPTLRKTGTYSVQPVQKSMSALEQWELALQVAKEHEARLNNLEGTVQQQSADIKRLTDRDNSIVLRQQKINVSHQEQLDQHEADITELKTVLDDKGPVEQIKVLISDVVKITAETDRPYSYEDAYKMFYGQLRKDHDINIATRTTALKKRKTDEGWTKTKVKQISGLDAITADPLIWEKVRETVEYLSECLTEAYNS